jgi:hypothetical protein
VAANQLMDAKESTCAAAVVEILGAHPDQTQRNLAMKYLRRCTTMPPGLLPRATEEVIRELEDPNPLNRQYASEYISIFGNRQQAAVLQKAITREPDPTTKTHMLENLKRLQTTLTEYPSHP